MVPCKKCSKAMIRADYFDRDGEIALVGGNHDKDNVWWVCISRLCEDGSKNTSYCDDPYASD